jgi:hypothetical protein
LKQPPPVEDPIKQKQNKNNKTTKLNKQNKSQKKTKGEQTIS